MAWPTRRSISVEDWNSCASLRLWVEDDVAINYTMTASSMRVTTSIVVHDAEHMPALARSKLFDARATMDNSNLKIAAWLNTGKEKCKVDPGQVTRKIFLAHCRPSKRATENHTLAELYVFEFYDSDTASCQKKRASPVRIFCPAESPKIAQYVVWAKVTREPSSARRQTTKSAAEDHASPQLRKTELYVSDTEVCEEHGPASLQNLGSPEPLKTAQALPFRNGDKESSIDIFRQIREQSTGIFVPLEDKLKDCSLCIRSDRSCDGARPCNQCSKNRSTCVDYGEELCGQDPQAKCHSCFKNKSRCDIT